MCSISLLHTHVGDTGDTCFQSSGTSPFSRDLENIICRIGATALAVSLRTLG